MFRILFVQDSFRYKGMLNTTSLQSYWLKILNAYWIEKKLKQNTISSCTASVLTAWFVFPSVAVWSPHSHLPSASSQEVSREASSFTASLFLQRHSKGKFLNPYVNTAHLPAVLCMSNASRVSCHGYQPASQTQDLGLIPGPCPFEANTLPLSSFQLL